VKISNAHTLGFIVFKLDMQTILNADFHLDRVIAIGGHTVRVDPEVFLFGYVCYAAGNGYADKISGDRSCEQRVQKRER